MCVESSSVHQDDFNSNMNKIIRSVDVSTYKKLHEEIEKKLVKQLKNYMTWQWYNQKCSDLIENLILTQSNIIQTPRKIKNIDFFVKLDDTYIFPFDLKLTIFPLGFMKDNKIPNERIMIETYISDVSNHYKILKWLYTEQNPRLFSNNYRHFIILLNLDNTDNSYKLKCNIELIKESVNKFFTTIQKSDIIDIEYEYKKDKAKSGKYYTKCSYILSTPVGIYFNICSMYFVLEPRYCGIGNFVIRVSSNFTSSLTILFSIVCKSLFTSTVLFSNNIKISFFFFPLYPLILFSLQIVINSSRVFFE